VKSFRDGNSVKFTKQACRKDKRAQAATMLQALNAWKALLQPRVRFIITCQKQVQEKNTKMHHCGEMQHVVNSSSLRALSSEQLQLWRKHRLHLHEVFELQGSTCWCSLAT